MDILIVESNTPDLLAEGRSGAEGFVRTLQALQPEARLHIEAPYARSFDARALGGMDGVIFTGSGVAWSTAESGAAPLRAAMELTFAQGLPVWGSCNGLQLAAVVLGGAVGASPKGREDGLARAMELKLGAQHHPMMAGRQDGFAVPCVHRDEVAAVPDGAEVLASNGHSAVQAMVYETDDTCFWGTQYHPEMTLTDVANCMTDKEAASDLRAAVTCDAAAARLGTSVAHQQTPVRALELANWLGMLRARKATHDPQAAA